MDLLNAECGRWRPRRRLRRYSALMRLGGLGSRGRTWLRTLSSKCVVSGGWEDSQGVEIELNVAAVLRVTGRDGLRECTRWTGDSENPFLAPFALKSAGQLSTLRSN